MCEKRRSEQDVRSDVRSRPEENARISPLRAHARLSASLYVLITAIYLISASGRIGLSDSVSMLNVSQSIITDGTFSAEPCNPNWPGHPNHCVPGRGGRYYAGFGLVPSILVVPAVWVADVLSNRLHVDSHFAARAAASLSTAVVAPLVCVVLALWIIRLGYSRLTAVIAAGLLGLASPFWHFSVKGFYSEPYATLALVVAAYLLFDTRARLKLALAGLAFGIACGVRVNAVLLFPAFIIGVAAQARQRRISGRHWFGEAVLFAAGFSICAVLIALSNYSLFGSPLKTGYHLAFPSASALLSHDFLEGVGDLLFNREVGLIIFAPWVVLVVIGCVAFTRAHLAESLLCTAIFLLSFLFFAKYASWHGGWVAGPRFLTPTLPFLIVATAPLIETLQQTGTLGRWHRMVVRPMALLLVGMSLLIQVLGVFHPEDRYYALMEFYEVRPVRPWRSGSIAIASLAFVRTMTMPTRAGGG